MQNPGQIRIIIHSAYRTSAIMDANPLPGNIFVVINMTIENLDETDSLIVNEHNFSITGGGPITQKLPNKLSNSFTWGSIPPKSSKTGEIVFGVKESTDQFSVTLRNDAGDIIYTKPIGAIPSGVFVTSL
jgi:hypothetical protein